MNEELITSAIARQDWMEPAEDALQNAVANTFKAAGETGQKIENALHGMRFGHPLHPILTDIPLGAWSIAAVFDLIEAGTGRNELSAGSDAAIGIGLAGALGSAVTGLTDWHKIDGRARRIGLVHGILNGTATALYAASWVMRRKNNRGAGLAYGFLGMAIVTAAAYLGGALVYEEKIGINHSDAEDLPQKFTPVLALDELPANTPTCVYAESMPVLLVKQNGRIYALENNCPHLGGPLSAGTLEGDSIRCPWHGSRFALADGRVLDSPAIYDQHSLEVQVRDGQIEVRYNAVNNTNQALAIAE